MTNKNELEIVINSIFDNIEKESNSAWNTSKKYFRIRTLQIDKRGSVGERFFQGY